jgi:RND superfamily putative drug exporter
MFARFGNWVARHWLGLLVFWLILFLASLGQQQRWFDPVLGPGSVPTWTDVAQDGEFTFLPPDIQSLVGERLLARAFPEDLLKSSVVVVVRRYQKPLDEVDRTFIREVLTPRLKGVSGAGTAESPLEIRSPDDKLVGQLLVSDSEDACLVVLPLEHEFLAWSNREVIDRVEQLIFRELPHEQDAERNPVIPVGLDLALSGTGTVGRDMLVAAQESASATERWTVVLVVLLLAGIYRAPLLALIPLLTVMVSVQVALSLLIWLTRLPPEWVGGWKYNVFVGLEVYITVVVYGTGVDYCLFLIARYKEELDQGEPLGRAIANSLSHVGAALTASAFTVICGIGMMIFAQFGKFREAGVGIGLALVVGFVASLTLTPSLLQLLGRWAFWPHGVMRPVERTGRGSWGTRLINRLIPRNKFQIFWDFVGDVVMRRPGTVLLSSVGLMAPLALIGFMYYDYLSYGLLSELPPTNSSVVGAKAVQEHFPAGYAGPLTILIESDEIDFNSGSGRVALEHVCAGLKERGKDLSIADIRSVIEPLGQRARLSPFQKGVGRRRAEKYYVSSVPGLEGKVTRIDLVFETDPFDRESIRLLDEVESHLRNLITAPHTDEESHALEPLSRARLYFVGPTGSIRDLKRVTDADQLKIDLLVLSAVFLILLVLLRKPGISVYLIVSVFFSYFAALGATFAAFWLWDPSGFAGLDWKVPMFLFTILIAIGEDYNIFLMTRIEEEQRTHGPVEGIREAMRRTGTIISSCGIIMAGTFLSLFAGTLVGLKQLGFALAFGVLLDTFVVRPLLVPAFLVLVYRGREVEGETAG